jgi:hypothetical protein
MVLFWRVRAQTQYQSDTSDGWTWYSMNATKSKVLAEVCGAIAEGWRTARPSVAGAGQVQG